MANKNTLPFNEIVNGRFGRKIAYTDVDHIDESNVVQVVADCYGVFTQNKRAIEYLYNYYKGDQPVLYRTKTMRDDIINKVVENHAFEIVQFKCAQSFGEPIQIVALNDTEEVNKAVDKFNAYTRAINKPARDIEIGIWQSATGTAYKGVQFTSKKDLPFRHVCLSPLNTFIIYSKQTHERLCSVQELKDENGRFYKLVFTASHEFRIQDSKLLPLEMNEDGTLVYSRLHAFGDIPIVEYPNNADRLSDIELVISLLDAINNMQSNRMDAVEQFVQSWIKFINCEIDEDTFKQMKMQGALVVKSNGDNKKVDVEVMTQELSQTESQVAKKDLWDNVLSISGIPNTEQGSDGGSTQGAVQLRSGWDFSKQRARLKDPFIIEAERIVDSISMNCIRIKGNNDVKLTPFDYDIQINHSPQDNMMAKVESLQILLNSGIHPLVAIKTIGLFEDSEKVFRLSEEYLNKMLYEVKDREEQEAKAKDILDKKKVKDGNNEK